MSGWLFLTIAAVWFAAGLACRRPRWVVAALALWALGLAVAALAGAFQPTAEDNALGMFVFTGVPTILWPGAFALGAAARLLAQR